MDTLEILKAGRAKISLVENFCQGSMAVDENNYETHFKGEQACAWCSMGAIRAVSANKGFRAVHNVLGILSECMGGPIADFNDSHTHAEVLEKWDEAIEKATGESA